MEILLMIGYFVFTFLIIGVGGLGLLLILYYVCLFAGMGWQDGTRQ